MNKFVFVTLFQVIVLSQDAKFDPPFYPPQETMLGANKVIVDILPDDEYRPNVEVYINGEGPFLFGIDWGLNAFVISQDLSAELGLKKVGTYEMPGMAEDYVEIKEMKIGDALFKGSTAFAKEMLDKRIQGVLGFNVFEQVLMTFDFPTKKLIFEKGELPEPDNNKIFFLAGKDMGERPDIEVSIGNLTFNTILDTRAFGWLIISDKYKEQLSLEGQKNEMLGRGPQMGTMTIMSSRVKETLKIGAIEVENPLVKFRNRQGAILGMGFMKNFTITLDKKNSRVKFETSQSLPLQVPEESWEKESVEMSSEMMPENPERFAGKYGVRTIYYENGQLFIQRDLRGEEATDQNGRRVKMVAPKLKLVYKGNNEFGIERISEAKVKFVEDENGNIIELDVFNPSLGWEKAAKEK